MLKTAKRSLLWASLFVSVTQAQPTCADVGVWDRGVACTIPDSSQVYLLGSVDSVAQSLCPRNVSMDADFPFDAWIEAYENLQELAAMPDAPPPVIRWKCGRRILAEIRAFRSSSALTVELR